MSELHTTPLDTLLTAATAAMGDALRITVGLAEDNRAVVEALGEVLAESHEEGELAEVS